MSGEITSIHCPDCGGTDLRGMYGSFWAALDSNGNDAAKNFSDHESSTEIGDDRLCGSCGTEFDVADSGECKDAANGDKKCTDEIMVCVSCRELVCTGCAHTWGTHCCVDCSNEMDGG